MTDDETNEIPRPPIYQKLMESTEKFKEAYGITTEYKDYGSQQNLADAHREYLAQVRQRHPHQDAPGVPHMIQWMEVTRTMFTDGVHLIPYRPETYVIGSLQFEAAGFMRRLLAEFIDFLIILTMKLGLVALLLDLDLIDLTSFGGALEQDQDVMQFINLAQDLLPLEMASKVFCCILEAFFMSHQILFFGIGQTPGKWFMGIRVISCTDVSAAEIPNFIVAQHPNTITFPQAIKRSFLKNVLVNSFFPLSTAAFQIINGRAFYDNVVGTAVVHDL